MGKEQFSYRITKNGKLFVYWHGEQGKREIVLKGPRAEKLTSELRTQLGGMRLWTLITA